MGSRWGWFVAAPVAVAAVFAWSILVHDLIHNALRLGPVAGEVVLAVAGMIARGTLRGYWQKGWRQTTILSPAWRETRELALEEGDATLARGPFEAHVLATLAEVTREPAAAADTATAHYRAAAEGPLTRIASWSELTDRWEDADVPWEATGVRVSPAAAEADDTRRAMAAASAADADLVAALLEVERAR